MNAIQEKNYEVTNYAMSCAQNSNASLVLNGPIDSPITKVTCEVSFGQVKLYVERIQQQSYNTSFDGRFGQDTQISEMEAMDYPRFSEDGEIIDDPNKVTKVETKNYIDRTFDGLDDEPQLLYDQYDEEYSQIVRDTFDDAFDYARSDESGWYYLEEDV